MNGRHKKAQGSQSAVARSVPATKLGELISGQQGSAAVVQKIYDFSGTSGLKALKLVSKSNLVVVHDYYYPTEPNFALRPLLFIHFQIEHCYSPKHRVSGAFFELMFRMYQAALQNELDCFLVAAAELPLSVPLSERKFLGNIAARFFNENLQPRNHQTVTMHAMAPAMRSDYEQKIERKAGCMNDRALTSITALGFLPPDEKSIFTPTTLVAKAQSYLVRAENLKQLLEHLVSNKEYARSNVLKFLKEALSRLITYKHNLLRLDGVADRVKLDLLSQLNPLMKSLFDMASELIGQIADVKLKAKAQDEVNTKKAADGRNDDLFRAAAKARQDELAARAGIHVAFSLRH